MSLLSRDIGGRLFGAVALVSIGLLALFGLFDLIDQLDSGRSRGISVLEACRPISMSCFQSRP